MSTVGKALIVAQVAFSILLMAFAAGVSSVQVNWKKQAKDAQAKFEKTDQSLRAANETNQKVRDAQTASEKMLKDAAAKSRGELDGERDKNKQLQTQLTQSRTELENMRAEAKIAGEESRARRDEAVSLRAINAQLHQTRDELITANRKSADTIVNLDQKVKSTDEKHTRLLNDYAMLQKFIRIKGFEGDPKEVAGLVDPPPIVQGVVLFTKKGNRNGSNLVEIDLGSDVGLAKGNELYIYRSDGKGKYLGKIRLNYVDYRTAVGVVIQSTKNGEIQRGDNVTTKL